MDLAWCVVYRLRNHLRGFRLMARIPRLSALLPMMLLFVSLAGLGYSPAVKAQEYRCTSTSAGCDEGEAYSEAWAYARKTAADNAPGYPIPCVYQSGNSFTAAAYGGSCNGNRVGTRTFYFVKLCKDRAPNHNTSIWSQVNGPAGSLGCMDGCHTIHTEDATNGTPTNYFGGSDKCDMEPDCSAFPGSRLNQLTLTCDLPEPLCPDGSKPNSMGKCAPEPCPAGKVLQPDGTCKSKENECPAGQIKSPDGKCLPGEGQCAEGEVRGADGTCKKDRDGDGEPDPGEEGEGPDGEKVDEFSGGDDCSTPPTCSGSPIMCGQARIQWRIDCNTRKNRNIAGGHCAQAPICTGEKCDALEYSGLLMQWRTACAIEKLAAANGTGTPSNPDLTAIRNALTGTGGTVDPGTSLPGSGAWVTPPGGQPTRPDTSGYGWGSGGCPSVPPIEIMGTSIQFDIAPLCSWLSLGSFFVMGLAALGSLRIVASKDA